MSIPVALDDLAATLERFGSGFLLTVPATTGGPKAVSVHPRLVGGVLHLDTPGRGSVANAAAHAEVTLLFPPAPGDQHALLVDGTARAEDEDLVLEPTSAVLHRTGPV